MEVNLQVADIIPIILRFSAEVVYVLDITLLRVTSENILE